MILGIINEDLVLILKCFISNAIVGKFKHNLCFKKMNIRLPSSVY